ncbi:LysR family transcriptional regulator [Devosia lacusdianchii]|jgi:DNA-binding transcriptional LysR family regulator|uniref:LysR family transcriptional regulator n=1 Tax=Devosia lacusdianchii TaxID=2917991 RepID=UPI001F0704C8|nr:LysR family transcriptional regulator [Devosia sp. JXJ CY 41]
MRTDINRAGEMAVFVAVVERGGFSTAARALRMTPSAVSKLITRLEARLGVRLLNRSTRTLQLSAEGSAFYDRATRILADLDEAERSASAGEQPAGRIRINTSASFGNHILAPLLPAFFAAYPAINLDVVQTDAVIDLLGERTDIAIRSGPLKSSGLIARKLGATPMVIVAAPSYLARHGTPTTFAELETHNRLGFSYSRTLDGWPLNHNGAVVNLLPNGNVQASNGEALRHLAIGGAGLTRLASYTVRTDIAEGRLVPVMPACDTGYLEEVHAVYVGQGGHLPTRVRVLLDFLAEHARLG